MTHMVNAMKQMTAFILCAALATSGCATTGMTQSVVSPSPTGDKLADRAVLAEYVQRLPAGSAVRIERTHRRTLRGTLMKATDRALFVQPRTRIAEPAIEIPMDDVIGVTLETASNGASVGKAVAAGAAAGAGVVLAMILISLALWSD
jgi:hypothetical protein